MGGGGENTRSRRSKGSDAVPAVGEGGSFRLQRGIKWSVFSRTRLQCSKRFFCKKKSDTSSFFAFSHSCIRFGEVPGAARPLLRRPPEKVRAVRRGLRPTSCRVLAALPPWVCYSKIQRPLAASTSWWTWFMSSFEKSHGPWITHEALVFPFLRWQQSLISVYYYCFFLFFFFFLPAASLPSPVVTGLEDPSLLLYPLLAVSLVLLFSSLLLALVVFLRSPRTQAANSRSKEANRARECAVEVSPSGQRSDGGSHELPLRPQNPPLQEWLCPFFSQISQGIPASPPAATCRTIPAPLRPACVSTAFPIWRHSARVMTGRWGLLSLSTRTPSYTEAMSKMEGPCSPRRPLRPLKGARNERLQWDKDGEDGQEMSQLLCWFQLTFFWWRRAHNDKQEPKKKEDQLGGKKQIINIYITLKCNINWVSLREADKSKTPSF